MKLLKAGVILLSFSAVALASRAVELVPPVFIEYPESITHFYAPIELGYERIIVTQDEEQLSDMINVQRAKEGADPLHWNNQLASVARFHSQEMIDNNYFNHDSKGKNGVSYETFNQRILRFNYHYYPIGENIAGCQTVQQAFQGWLNSPGHHENMVRKSFSEAGLGIRVGGPYGKMFTHDFGYRQIEYDLSISSEDISSTQVDSKLLITALVHNPGTTHAYPVMVRFYEGNPEGDGQQLGSDYKVPAIIIGDDYRPDTAKIEWSTSGDSGEIEIYVVVDPENEFEESNESNNIAFRTLSYGRVGLQDSNMEPKSAALAC